MLVLTGKYGAVGQIWGGHLIFPHIPATHGCLQKTHLILLQQIQSNKENSPQGNVKLRHSTSTNQEKMFDFWNFVILGEAFDLVQVPPLMKFWYFQQTVFFLQRNDVTLLGKKCTALFQIRDWGGQCAAVAPTSPPHWANTGSWSNFVWITL